MDESADAVVVGQVTSAAGVPHIPPRSGSYVAQLHFADHPPEHSSAEGQVRAGKAVVRAVKPCYRPLLLLLLPQLQQQEQHLVVVEAWELSQPRDVAASS